jgi:ATP-dependent DNA helicase RecG
MNLLDSPIRTLSGIGAAYQKQLAMLGVRTCRDLLFYFPYRFDDFSEIVPIAGLQPGMTATVRGKITLIANRRSSKQRKILTEALISDASGSVKVIWFNQPFLIKNLAVGDVVNLSGKTSNHMFDLQLVSPQYEKIHAGRESVHTGRLVPVYSLTENITQKQFRALMKAGLSVCMQYVSEWIPEDIIKCEGLCPIYDALYHIHFPQSQKEWNEAKKRFQFEELFSLQLTALHMRNLLQHTRACAIPFFEKETKDFVVKLPFPITEAQRRSAWEIIQDCKKDIPMNRILEGDVGSGKTAVAAIVGMNSIRAGCQVAYMAPTEILARQHYKTLSEYMAPYRISVGLLTSAECRIYGEDIGKNKKKQEKKHTLLQRIADGAMQCVVGTHALLQENVLFHKLGLVIIDEQHRFGVQQRKALREKSGVKKYMPHLLSLTATPIPRSLALTLYGDLDISLLDELPKGRKEIITKIVPLHYRQWTYDFIKKEIKKGHQAIIICPTIEQSDVLGVKSVKKEYARLSKDIFPHNTLVMVHGKMNAEKKQEAMQKILAREADILVATSVVEVGVDIPNATVMAIEGAERFGLAQLHQFRGRVGRSRYQSYCFLLPTSEEKGDERRLKALAVCANGFELAEKDLELRGPGEVFGRQQSGMFALKIADIRDIALIKKAREWASRIIEKIETYPELQERMQSFEKDAHLE